MDSQKLTVVLVDDQASSRIQVLQVLEQHPRIGKCVTFADAISCLTYCLASPPNLAFLDVEMDDFDGMWLGTQLRKLAIPFVFVSMHNHHALDAFSLNALHYLQKPVSTEGIEEVVQRWGRWVIQTNQSSVPTVQTGVSEVPRRIFVNTQKQILILQLSDILFLQADGSYTHFYLNNGSVVVSGKNLKKYEDMVLMNPDFVKIHRSYVINQSHLQSIDKRKRELTFHFSNDRKIQVATFRKDEWLDRFL